MKALKDSRLEGTSLMKVAKMSRTLTFVLSMTGLVLADIRASDAPPNVILIITDDMGYSDLASFGPSEIPTPHIDRLAESGVRLTNAYASAPICVPSRMGLLTGRYQQRFGVYTNVYTAEESRLWLKETTLADLLRTEGYATGLIGKWHLSGNKLPWPMPGPDQRGFDEFIGLGGGMADFWKGTSLLRFDDGEYQPFEAPEYLTDYFGREAEAFIRRSSGTPFFLLLAFNAPHAPLHALEADQAEIEANWISPERRAYGGMIAAVDRNVGLVMRVLAEEGLENNTFVVFANDNGGGGNNAKWFTRNTARNLPWRGHKYDLEEGGIRVPVILSWSGGQIVQNQEFSGLTSLLDIFPTVLAAAGVDHPPGRECDGVDLLPFLRGSPEHPREPHEFLCWQQVQFERPNQRAPSSRGLHQFAIREGRWKAIRQDQSPSGTPERAWELYDLSRDPSELQDVATEFPTVTARLAGQFDAWQSQMHPLIAKPMQKKE